MERHERAASNRHRGGRAGHHVMIAAAVVRVLVADRADNCELVGGLGQIRHRFAELDARHGSGNRLELAANLGRRIGLGIERLVMRRPAVEPDHDAIDLLAGRLRHRL